jgi:hypothetical protein
MTFSSTDRKVINHRLGWSSLLVLNIARSMNKVKGDINMKNYPERIHFPDEDVPGCCEFEPRACDYCDTMLIDEYGSAVQTAYLTDFGLFCSECIGVNQPESTYFEGESVIDQYWYLNG